MDTQPPHPKNATEIFNLKTGIPVSFSSFVCIPSMTSSKTENELILTWHWLTVLDFFLEGA